ncbi:RDD family protein [Thermodesulfobacteriota bacterium]
MKQRKPVLFLSRTMAFLIDTAFLIFLHAGCSILLGQLFYTGTPHTPALFLVPVYLMLLAGTLPIFTLLYFMILHSSGGQTLGKYIMGVKVVTSSGLSLSPGTAFLRWVGYIVSGLPLAAGFLWAAIDHEHSAWHDKLADTRVVATRNSLTS